ncbi:MAG TPA: ATP-binding protein [Syntrophales bacterium]|nr:ATP-binding protein [Syntrophales bacterium]
MIPRNASKSLIELSRHYPIATVTGPRQSGKTTLVRAAFPEKPYVSFEDPDHLEEATADPRGFLARYGDGAILDEAQKCPHLFSYLQSNVDLDGRMGRFILTGSQQFGLLSKIGQSLAGRTGIIQLLPFSLEELETAGILTDDLNVLLFKGLYPPIYDRNIPSPNWYAGYMMTYIERDLRQLINVRDLSSFQRFVRMCAARTGQLLNLSSLANDCGITHNTARSWLSVLEASYLVFTLMPYYRNFNKRLVKTPKLYFFDTGLAAWLLGIQNPEQLSIHPMRGPLFESLVISELIKDKYNQGLATNLYFWRDSTGNEIDVIIDEGGKVMPLEIKSGQTVTQDFFTGLHRWFKLSGVEKGMLIYGGNQPQARRNIEVSPWRNLKQALKKATATA